MTDRLSRLAIASMAVGVMLMWPITADAASLIKVGWWHRSSDPSSAIPRSATPPGLPDAGAQAVAPPIPDGHLLVEGTAEGPTAIAALTFELNDRESSPLLRITPAQGSRTPDDMLLLACRASVDWTTPETGPGRWQDKPLVDCTRSLNGILGEDGTITFALQVLVSGPELDVVLVPGVVASTPGGPIGSTFSLVFDAVNGAAIQTVMAARPPLMAEARDVNAPSDDLSVPIPTFVAPSDVVVAPALEPEEQAPIVPEIEPPSDVRPAVSESGSARTLGIVILAFGAVLFGLSRFTSGGRGVGAEPSEPVMGGLGRFVRARTENPGALS